MAEECAAVARGFLRKVEFRRGFGYCHGDCSLVTRNFIVASRNTDTHSRNVVLTSCCQLTEQSNEKMAAGEAGLPPERCTRGFLRGAPAARTVRRSKGCRSEEQTYEL